MKSTIGVRSVPGIILLLFSNLALAGNSVLTVNLTGVVVGPPSCIFNGDKPINVDFGNEIPAKSVDGVSYQTEVNYQLECKTLESKSVQLKVEGTPAEFDSKILKSSKDNLGIALLNNGKRIGLGEWIKFEYPTKPVLSAVLVKKDGSTLTGGKFESAATMIVDYQ